jgi:hypothetical protein
LVIGDWWLVVGGWWSDILKAVTDHDRSRPDASQRRCLGTSSVGVSLDLKVGSRRETGVARPRNCIATGTTVRECMIGGMFKFLGISHQRHGEPDTDISSTAAAHAPDPKPSIRRNRFNKIYSKIPDPRTRCSSNAAVKMS